MATTTKITLEKKLGTAWVPIPSKDGIGSELSELTLYRFTGVMFDSPFTGSYVLKGIPLDIQHSTILSFKMASLVPIRKGVHVCLGVIEAADMDFMYSGEFRITCEGIVDDQSIFKCVYSFTLNNGLFAVDWTNISTADTFHASEYLYETADGYGIAYPIMFIFDERDYPIYAKLRTNDATESALRASNIAAIGCKASMGTGIPAEATITFNVPTTEFSPIAAITVMSGTKITLPKPDALANAEGVSWKINGVSYQIGEQFIMPEYNVSASLDYEVFNYKGVIIV